MLLLPSPNKARLSSFNPKQSEISTRNAEVIYNLREMLVSTQRREPFEFETITKHTLGWEIDERNSKIMNLTYFRIEIKRECGKQKQQPRQLQICHRNIRHQKFIWEHHMWCHVTISEVTTLASIIPNFWCSLEIVATELQLCFVVKRNVSWKRTFLPTVTTVVLHH